MSQTMQGGLATVEPVDATGLEHTIRAALELDHTILRLEVGAIGLGHTIRVAAVELGHTIRVALELGRTIRVVAVELDHTILRLEEGAIGLGRTARVPGAGVGRTVPPGADAVEPERTIPPRREAFRDKLTICCRTIAE